MLTCVLVVFLLLSQAFYQARRAGVGSDEVKKDPPKPSSLAMPEMPKNRASPSPSVSASSAAQPASESPAAPAPRARSGSLKPEEKAPEAPAPAPLAGMRLPQVVSSGDESDGSEW